MYVVCFISIIRRSALLSATVSSVAYFLSGAQWLLSGAPATPVAWALGVQDGTSAVLLQVYYLSLANIFRRFAETKFVQQRVTALAAAAAAKDDESAYVAPEQYAARLHGFVEKILI